MHGIKLLSLLALILASGQQGLLAQEAGLASPGSPLHQIQDALVRGKNERAARLLEALPPALPSDPSFARLAAERALLEIALAPPDQRVHRYLVLASSYPEEEAGLTALAACLDLAVDRLRRGWRAAWDRGRGEAAASPLGLAELLQAAAPLLEGWEQTLPGDSRTILARQLLERARAGAPAEEPDILRLRSGATIPVPYPLGEDVRVRLHSLPDPESPIDHLLEGRSASPPLLEEILPASAGPQSLAAPAPGAYLLEVQGVATGWRRVRRLLISDLDLVSHTSPDLMVVLATLGEQPKEGVAVRLLTDDGEAVGEARTDSEGVALLPRPAPPPGERGATTVKAAIDDGGGLHLASLQTSPPSPASSAPELSAHLMTDRPLYRPGETVQGRLVVRRHDPVAVAAAGEGTGFRPVTRPLAGRSLRLKIFMASGVQREVEVVTDDFGVAPFTFPLRLSDPPGFFQVEAWLPLSQPAEFRGARSSAGHGPHVLLAHETPARILEFRRPPLLLEIASPREWIHGSDDPTVEVKARHPTGVPAAGLSGSVKARVGTLEHLVPFLLDDAGEARVRLALQGLDLRPEHLAVSFTASVLAPDGQEVNQSQRLRIAFPDKGEAKTETPRSDAALSIETPAEAVAAGAAAQILLSGPAGAPVLLTVAREQLFLACSTVLDNQGRAEVTLPTQEDWLPRVELVASLGGSHRLEEEERWWRRDPNVKRTTLHLGWPAERLKILLEKDREVYGPGESASWQLTTLDGLGKAVEASVAVSVVDETLFALQEDRTRDPRRDLEPTWHSLHLLFAGSRLPGSPWHALGLLLRKGTIDPPIWEEENEHYGLGGGAGGSAGGRGGQRALGGRQDFRATAFFDPSVRTGPDGKATLSFSFPDDLTTWRITLAAIDGGRGGALERMAVRTEKACSVEPLLPRILRAADTVVIPARVAQTAGTSSEVEVEARAGDRLQVEEGPGSRFVLTTSPGEAREGFLHLRATSPGQGSLDTLLRRCDDAEILDRIRRTVPVLSRESRRTTYESALVQGEGELSPPRIPGLRPVNFTVELLGSREALLRQAANWLSHYPHGCAEQTASRLVPVALAAHARLGLGAAMGAETGDPEAPARLSPEQAHRLELGMARLRRLQTSDGGFAWWEGQQKSDPAISATVLRTLALLREAGIDGVAYGIKLDGDLGILQEAARSCAGTAEPEKPKKFPFPRDALAVLREGESAGNKTGYRLAAAAAELTAAGLLLNPAEEASLRAGLRLADAAPSLPPGLLARLGRALALAGEVEAAREALGVLRARLASRGALGSGAAIDESPASRAAALLDLVLAVDPENALRPRLVVELLRRHRDGRMDHTAGTAAALVALARDRANQPPEPPTKELPVVVEGKGFRREVSLDSAAAWRAQVECPAGTEAVRISGPAGADLVVTARAVFTEDGPTARPLAEPIRLTRTLRRLLPAASGSWTRVEEAAIHAGDVLEVEFEIAGSPDLSYLVLECPLPAGFEPLRNRSDIVTYDDRVVVGLPALDDDGRAQISIRLVAALEGQVAWPPATVEAMYQPELAGRSRGDLLEIQAVRPPRSSAGEVTVLGPAFLREQREALQARLAEEKDTQELIPLLRALAGLPESTISAWLVAEAPRFLGQKLTDPRVAKAWIDTLGPHAWEGLSEDRLARLQETTGVSVSEMLLPLGRALVTSGLGDEVARRFVAGDARPLEMRLYALGTIFAESLPPELSAARRLEKTLDLLTGGPGERSPEVQAERMQALTREFFWRAIRPESLVREPARELRQEIWERDGIAVGGWPRPAEARLLGAFLEEVTHLWLEADRRTQDSLVPALDGLLALWEWPDQGSVEPGDHRRLSRQAAALRRDLEPTVLARIATLLDVEEGFSKWWELLVRDRPSPDRIRLAVQVLDLLLPVKGTPPSPPRIANAAQVLGSVAASSGVPALRALVFRVLRYGPSELRGDAWSLLSPRDRRAVPLAALMDWTSKGPSGTWTARELLARGPSGEKALMDLVGSLEDPSLLNFVARRVSPEALASLDLGTLLRLCTAIQGSTASELRDRMVECLVRGPWSSRELAAQLARAGDPDRRQCLLRAVAGRGFQEVPWDRAEPAWERYRLLLACRQRDPKAADEVRRWLRDPALPRSERVDILWALEPQAVPSDLLPVARQLPVDTLEGVLGRASPAEVAALWEDPEASAPDLRALLQALPEPLASRMAESAAEAFRAGKPALAVLGRASLPAALTALRPHLLHLKRDRALAALQAPECPPELALAVAEDLAGHEDAGVRRQAAALLYRLTGVPRSWVDALGHQHQAGPRDAAAHRRDLRKQLGREGLGAAARVLAGGSPEERQALEEALATMGLHLSP